MFLESIVVEHYAEYLTCTGAICIDCVVVHVGDCHFWPRAL